MELILYVMALTFCVILLIAMAMALNHELHELKEKQKGKTK
jgi:hypothetical protein